MHEYEQSPNPESMEGFRPIREINLLIGALMPPGGKIGDVIDYQAPLIEIVYETGIPKEYTVETVERLSRYEAYFLSFSTYLGPYQNRTREDFGERNLKEGLITLETTDTDIATGLVVHDIDWSIPRLGFLGALISPERNAAPKRYIKKLELNGGRRFRFNKEESLKNYQQHKN